MDGASLKKSLIVAMSSIPSFEGLENNELILTTAAGNICGKLISDDQLDSETDLSGVIANICGEISKKYLDNLSSTEFGVDGNDGYLFLTDVSIKSCSSNFITHLPFMVVFYDQIIGVSIGRND